MERGYFVIEWKDGVWKRISPVYQVHDAAVQFRDLAIKEKRVVEVSDNITTSGRRKPIGRRRNSGQG